MLATWNKIYKRHNSGQGLPPSFPLGNPEEKYAPTFIRGPASVGHISTELSSDWFP